MSECPIYLEEGNKPTPGDCSSYPRSCISISCRYHSIGDIVRPFNGEERYRITSFDCYGNCNIPIFNIEPLEQSEIEHFSTRHSVTACYLIKAVDKNDISFYTPFVKAE